MTEVLRLFVNFTHCLRVLKIELSREDGNSAFKDEQKLRKRIVYIL